MRPIGGWLLGSFGDKYGKRKALFLSLLLMFFPAFALSVTPTYAKIGLWAPVILSLSRLLQGLSGGGELIVAAYTMVSLGTKKEKFTNLSWSLAAGYLGVVVASICGFLLAHSFSHYFFIHYAWRIAFAIGGIISITGLIWRYFTFPKIILNEPSTNHITSEKPSVFRNSIKMIALIAPAAFVSYLLIGFLPTLLIINYGLAANLATLSIAGLMFGVIITMIIVARFMPENRIQQSRSTLLFLLFGLSFPLMYGIMSKNTITIFMSILTMGLFFGCYAVPMIYHAMSDFPKSQQLKDFGFNYNLSYSVFGGTAPLMAQWLHKQVYFLAIYLSLLALIALCFNDRFQKNQLNISG